MKKTVTLILLTFFFVRLNAQFYVDGQLLSERFQGKYITVCPERRGLSKYLACIDYGQKIIRRPGRNREIITDENGQEKIFFSRTGIMNFMYKNGFEVLQFSDSTACILYCRKE